MDSLLLGAWLLTIASLVRTGGAVETDCYDHRMPKDLGLTAYVNIGNDANVWFYKMWTPMIGDDAALRRTCIETAPDGIVFLGMIKTFAQMSGILKDNMVTCYGVRDYQSIVAESNPGWIALHAVERTTGYINHDTDFVPMRVYTAKHQGKWYLLSELIYLSMPFFDDKVVAPFCKVWPNIVQRERMDLGAPVTDCKLNWKHFVLAVGPSRETLLEKTPIYRRKCEGETPLIPPCSAEHTQYREALAYRASVAILPNEECRARELTASFRQIFTDRYKCSPPNILRPRVSLSVAQEIIRTATNMLRAGLFAMRSTFLTILQEWQGVDPYIALKGLLAALLYHKTGNGIVTLVVLAALEGLLRLTGLEI